MSEIIMKGIGVPDDPAKFVFKVCPEGAQILGFSTDMNYFIFEKRCSCDEDEDQRSSELRARRESIHFWLQHGASVKELYCLGTGEQS